jgi:ribosomal protein S27E
LHAQTVCAQVARRLGEPLRLVERRGFQPMTLKKKRPRPTLSAVRCPFCGQELLVSPGAKAIDVDCGGCDTTFEADAGDVFAISIDDVVRPEPRRLFHDL